MQTNQATTAAKAQITDDIEWGIIEGENTEFAAQYARFQWIHGSKQSAGFMKTGGLFVPKEQYPNFTTKGFEPTVLTTRDGTEIEGYAASSARLAVIRIKHQWVKDETYGKNTPLAHVLCVIDGCPDLVCISLRGPSKALDFQKAFNQHLGQNVALANRTRPDGAKPVEPFALWFPLISGEQHSVNSKDGKATSSVTSPELFTPETLDRDYVITLWVGAANYKQFVGYYRETEGWQKQPIWEQRNGSEAVDHAPGYSGNGDGNGNGNGERILQTQIEHIVGICEAKGLDVKQLVLTATDGATNNIGTLTQDEAREIIETAKAY